jgi:hypothetical protein
MRDSFVKFRATEEERERWRVALEQDGRTLAEICRAALDRIAKRYETDR